MFIRKYWIPLSVFIIAIVGVSLYYLQTRPPKDPIVIYKPVEPEKPTVEKSEVETEAPVAETAQGGHFHEAGTFHTEPHEPIAAPSEVSESEVSTETTAPQMEYNRGGNNPLPYGNVDIRDFEAAKTAMIENANFIKANWDPEKFFDIELGREMRIAYARATNIANAAMSGIYTRQQAREMNALYYDLGISDMIGNAADEIVQRQGVE